MGDIGEIRNRLGQAVKLGDDKYIALTHEIQCPVKLGRLMAWIRTPSP
jgi:hypothetical protein